MEMKSNDKEVDVFIRLYQQKSHLKKVYLDVLAMILPIESTCRDYINLRPRHNRNFEANIVKFTMSSIYEEAKENFQRDHLSKVISKELDSYEKNRTWTAVKRTDQETITIKWVIAVKRDENGEVTRYKGRLCERGFK